uniref:COMM domain-containing protein 9-like n=1 Tax=Podarcis muralis TaxID=64176 RepID=UPI00109FA545
NDPLECGPCVQYPDNYNSKVCVFIHSILIPVSLPRLVDLDWRVDIKTSSDSISRMAVPTCLLQLKIQEDAALCGNDFTTSALTVELNKQTLDTMLDGLGRIRDQLSAVANK